MSMDDEMDTHPVAETSNARARNDVIEMGSGSGSIAAVDLKSGHRVAYDPRDLNDERETLTNPRLNLMEEILLLGLKDRQGYLSFWNENISYALRGCILIELALRDRIRILKHADNKLADPADRIIEVRSTKHTGEPLLDETLRLIKANSPASIVGWMDLLSGETWNVMKLNLQLKQVRERIAKGLVDKGVLRTEKRNFLLFDMPTHPLADPSQKDAVLRRLYALLTSKSQSVHPDEFYKEDPGNVALRVTRTLCMVCCAYCANVLENTLTHLSSDTGEQVFRRVGSLLSTFGQWPMAPDTPGGGIPRRSTSKATAAVGSGSSKKRKAQPIGVGDAELAQAMCQEMETSSNEAAFEVVAGVLNVFVRMDALV
ncbi:hypothetical protein CBS9595_002639 [Malassezia furfur]|nr:hypothetical protein CBS9595_002639 [Malassezia furfur]